MGAGITREETHEGTHIIISAIIRVAVKIMVPFWV